MKRPAILRLPVTDHRVARVWALFLMAWAIVSACLVGYSLAAERWWFLANWSILTMVYAYLGMYWWQQADRLLTEQRRAEARREGNEA